LYFALPLRVKIQNPEPTKHKFFQMALDSVNWKLKISVVVVAFLPTVLLAQRTAPLKLWYNQPAANWNEALPIGNGRLAAMVFGTPATERIELNEKTVWADGPNNNAKPDVFPIVQQTELSS